MKKAIIIFVFIFNLILLTACDNKIYHWQFNKDVIEIQKISIINLDINERFPSDTIVNSPPIKVIESSEYETIYEEIQNLEMTKMLRFEFDYPNGYSFLIDYGNDYYCVLAVNGSGYIYYSEEANALVFNYKKLDFKEEAFIALINKYLED